VRCEACASSGEVDADGGRGEPLTSKYDGFWEAQLDALAGLVERAAEAEGAELDAAAVLNLGQRSSWYGTAVVCNRNYRAEMAHMASLGRTVANAALCVRWPDVEFRFTLNQAGRLSVSTGGRALTRSARRLPPVDAPRPVPGASEPTLSLDADLACAAIHELLTQLPLFETPDEVPFANGLYFFYENGESSEHAPAGRVVRVGNHPRTQDRLRARLKDHYRTREGAKNGSVFRRYVGGALLRRDDAKSACLEPSPGAGHWERQGATACQRCRDYENAVTAYLSRSFGFRCVRIDDTEERNRFEALIVATLAACSTCQPSAGWLGRYAYSTKVHSSGLWNSEFVGGPTIGSPDLARLHELVAASGALAFRHPGSDVVGDLGEAAVDTVGRADLSDTLLIIPCCGGKHGRGALALPSRSVTEFLSDGAREVLHAGRAAAFERRGTSVDETMPAQPALRLYTGQPYATPGLRDAIVRLIADNGLHCLIVSGGYGLVRPEELIHKYDAQIQQTAPVWRRRVPALLSDYVERQRIRRTFGAFSRPYGSVVPSRLTGEDWRAVPTFNRGDDGSPYREVPRRVGLAVMHLIESGFVPERAAPGSATWAFAD
jgi:hypothetical protein